MWGGIGAVNYYLYLGISLAPLLLLLLLLLIRIYCRQRVCRFAFFVFTVLVSWLLIWMAVEFRYQFDKSLVYNSEEAVWISVFAGMLGWIPALIYSGLWVVLIRIGISVMSFLRARRESDDRNR